MTREKQLNLFRDPRRNTKIWWIKKQSTYGGSMNYRKVPRPFDSKKLTHTVLKSTLPPNLGFNRFHRVTKAIIEGSARRYGIKIKDLAIHADHIHVLTFTKSREAQTKFLRFISAELGRYFARLRRRLGYSVNPLWTARPFTRLVSWGRKSLNATRAYIRRNRYEALGFIDWRPRHHPLSRFLARWSEGMARAAPS